MVFKSEPLLLMPQTGLTHFIFYNPNNVADDKPIFIDAETNTHITFGQLRNLVFRLNHGLRRVGFKKGDVLCIYSANKVDYPVIVHGTVAAGGVVSPANAAYTVEELAYQLQQANAKYIVTSEENLRTALAAAQQAGIPKKDLFLFGQNTVDGVLPYTQAILADDECPAEEYDFEQAKTSTAYLCFSSGTTGRSKGVMSSHTNIATNCLQIAQAMKSNLVYNTATFVGFLPFYHIYGLMALIHLGVYWGIPVVVMPRFDLPKFCQAVERYKVTIAHVVPPVLVLLAKDPIVSNYDLSTVTHYLSGAAPLSAELSMAVSRRLNSKCVQSYGMTESSPGSHIQPLDDDTHGIVGRMLPGMTAKIVNQDGKGKFKPMLVGLDERGELWMAGPNIMQGYLNMPNETAATIDSEGYLHTGDVAIIDKNGMFSIVDRVKELIKYKGFQVAPAELESLLLQNDLVADCAVIGVYDDSQATELPRAYIKVSPGVPENDQTAKALIQFVDQQVATHKKLRGGVRFLDIIPKSAAGKILRRDLRVMAASETKESIQAKL